MASDRTDPTTPHQAAPASAAEVTAAEVRAALEVVLASTTFASSERLRRFLRYIVEEWLAGRGEGLKEYPIGTEVCDRPGDFDPRADPVVRVEARRLRARLADFYAGEGRGATLVISVPKGGYVPAVERRAADGPGAAGDTAAEPASRPDAAGSAASPARSGLWHAVVVVVLAVVALVAGLWWPGGRAAAVPGNGVAVLPFRNASADPENDYFCFGLVEDLTAALTEVDGLRVVARTSAERAGEHSDLVAVAGRLRVRYLVEGSVRREGPRLRVSARLVDVRDGSPLWADTYDRQLDDVFAAQTELAHAIASALMPRLGLANASVRPHKAPRNLAAHTAFLKGQFLYRTQPDSHAQAAGYLREAIAADPAYAPAHLELAALHATTALDSIAPPAAEVALARQGVQRALLLDPTLADAVALKAWIRFFSDWDWHGAARLFEDALAMQPASSVAHHRYALLLMTAGRFDEAITHAQRALEIDPLSYRLVNGCAVIEFCARRYPAAERLARESTMLAPKFYLAHLILGSTLVEQGRVADGIAAYREALEVQPREPDATASLGRALARAGRADEARALLAELEAPGSPRPPSRYELAFLLAALGERERAFTELQTSLARHETELVYLGVDPLFDPLRGDPRFDVVLRAVGVPRP